MNKWRFLNSKSINNYLNLVNCLLDNRKIINKTDFLSYQSPSMIDNSTYQVNEYDLIKAERLIKNLARQAKIVIFGDYDTDGILASAILWRSLSELGFVPIPYIPDRKLFGYGLSVVAIEDLLHRCQPDLIITVDNGISAKEASEYLKKKGIPLIITDHHSFDNLMPEAVAIIHTYQVAGTVVTWLLARQLTPHLADQFDDYLAIATVADMMSLSNVLNRRIVLAGLKFIKQKKSLLGLQTLLEHLNIIPSKINEQDIGYRIAPTINASGRVGNPLNALRLFTVSYSKHFSFLSTDLIKQNKKRKELTQFSLEHAESLLIDKLDKPILMVKSSFFDLGVIGLVAGELVKKYQKPAIVGTEIDGKQVRASIRSIQGLDIIKVMRSFSSYMIQLGGHSSAGGLTVTLENWQQLEVLLFEKLKAKLVKQKHNTIKVDAIIDHSLYGQELWQLMQKLAPFGYNFPIPILVLQQTVLIEWRIVKQRHMFAKFILSNQQIVEAVFWNQDKKTFAQLERGGQYDLLGNIEEQIWQEKNKMVFRLIDFRKSRKKFIKNAVN